ncbi:hypothetical protein HMPREF0083_04268 [Aneurinibacillus aneurinilyticus ATCC 12856]|uniref:Uncharacterized protein n=1 Tax=Aneurinibacillus aneurinilyticus ATCC 12856 TaxID=649747 RepID=U1WZF9_ANEAE|nr:hypothetical protein HMPREF0083_04268 [Aneurinibacillus aneurinilyticus ATCC 12856]
MDVNIHNVGHPHLARCLDAKLLSEHVVMKGRLVSPSFLVHQ